MPLSVHRDDLGWTPFPTSPIAVYHTPAEDSGLRADIIQFPTPSLPDLPWQPDWDSQGSRSSTRRTTREPANGNCGLAVVADHCRELAKGSRHSQEVRHDSRAATYRMDSPGVCQPVFVTVMSALDNHPNSEMPAASRHSTAVLHGGHLMHHFGPWVVALLAIQLGSAWMIGTVAGQVLGTGRYFHTTAWLLLMLVFNLQVWFRYYGRKSKAFHVPGIGLFLSAILPVFLLRLLAFLQS